MPKTVLVADDEMLIALEIEGELASLGHTPLVAATTAEALHHIETNHIDLAIIDWHRRDHLADSLIAHLSTRHIPFIICSGTALEELASLFPAAQVVTKPFSSAQLVATVEHALSSVSLH